MSNGRISLKSNKSWKLWWQYLQKTIKCQICWPVCGAFRHSCLWFLHWKLRSNGEIDVTVFWNDDEAICLALLTAHIQSRVCSSLWHMVSFLLALLLSGFSTSHHFDGILHHTSPRARLGRTEQYFNFFGPSFLHLVSKCSAMWQCSSELTLECKYFCFRFY